MKIDDAKAFEQLNVHGRLATLRNFNYTVGRIVKITHNGKEMFHAVIIAVLVNRSEFLRQYQEISGFETIEEWTKRAIELNRRIPDFIVVLEKLDFRNKEVEWE